MLTSANAHLLPASSLVETLTVERYSASRKEEWDYFVRAAKNATFLFCRDYMDYHMDRFSDCSLMILRENKLVAVLPANLALDGTTLVSHEGLTYGGLVLQRPATLWNVMACFHAGLRYLHEHRITQLLYKRIPNFYNTQPDGDVEYVLFLLDSRLCRCDCTVVVSQDDRLRLRKGRKSEITKGRRLGVNVVQEMTFASFWEQVLIPRLAGHHGIKPVHTVEEITLLALRFPENIKQFSAYSHGEIVAGTTIYETDNVAHAQYIAVTDKGRKIGALDYLIGWLIDERYKDKRYFDFGSCNENQGRRLNHGLLSWKEGFGGRSYVHDFYEIATESYSKLEPVLKARSSFVSNSAEYPHSTISSSTHGSSPTV